MTDSRSRHTTEYRIDAGDSKRELRDIQRGIDSVDDATEKLEKSSKELTDQQKKQSRSFREVLSVAADAKLAFGDMSAVVGRFTGAIKGAITAQAEQIRVEKQLEAAIRGAGKTRAEAMRISAQAFAEFARHQQETIFGDEDQARALTSLIRRTGDTESATKLLTLAMDAATASGNELADAAKTIGEAATGDLGPLKELGILTAEQINTFNQITDSNERWNQALTILEQKIGGARHEISQMEQTMAQAANDMGDVEQAAGALATALLGVAGAALKANDEQTGLQALASTLNETAKFWDDYAEATTGATAAQDIFIQGIPRLIAEQAGLIDTIEERIEKVRDERARRRARDRKAQERAADENFRREALSADPAGPILEESFPEGGFAGPLQKDAAPSSGAAESKAQATDGQLEAMRAILDAAQKKAELDVEEIDRINEIVQLGFDRGNIEEEFARRRLEIAREENDIERTKMEFALRRRQIEESGIDARTKSVELERADLEEKNALQKQAARTDQEVARTRVETANQIADVAGQAAGIAIENKQLEAAVQAAIEFALGIGTMIINPAEATAHFAASTLLNAIAAGQAIAGMGGGGGGAISKGSSTAQSQRQQVERQQLSREQLEGSGVDSGLNITLNFRSISRPTDDEADRMFDAVRRAAENRL